MIKQEVAYLSEVLKAYSEGKKIELVSPNNIIPIEGDIVKVLKQIEGALINGYEVRIKPKYRPYKDAEEFLKAQKEHGPYIKSDSGMMCAYYSVRMVHPVDEGVTLHMPLGMRAEELDYKELLEKYLWQDGHLMGILEE